MDETLKPTDRLNIENIRTVKQLNTINWDKYVDSFNRSWVRYIFSPVSSTALDNICKLAEEESSNVKLLWSMGDLYIYKMDTAITNKSISLQLTKLTGDDIATHENLYINELLVNCFEMPPGCCGQLYYDHAITELQKANELFLKMFG